MRGGSGLRRSISQRRGDWGRVGRKEGGEAFLTHPAFLFALFLFQSPVTGADGFMHKPCFRVYDKDRKHLYIDIDWFREYSAEEVEALRQPGVTHAPHKEVPRVSALEQRARPVPTD